MYDHYQEANRLIFSLENIGHADIAKTLRETLEGGATGSEIFMGLRFLVGKLLKNAFIPEDMKSQAKILFIELDRELRQ